ncbi:hypothetical protein [Streptomyces afghaniensis]|uniref:hypothetical protein n=1 Tax=Streptomyces afghaniensis TaxID=66865 RepID=UPI0027898C84|nr:hypothetical protein [Streptomyces afghaniensis]MDQ1019961.1 hypothetical protein [Streptomyces afghaniensis]
MGLRMPRFHPLSDNTPLFETQRALRGHNFYPGARVLRSLAPRDPRRKPEASPCIVYHSPWGHLVVTEINPENLNGYGWTCRSSDPGGAEWGDLGYMGEFERRCGRPWEFWERDLFSDDANAAAAVARILQRYTQPVRRETRQHPEHERIPAAPVAPTTRPASTPIARVPRASRGVMSRR